MKCDRCVKWHEANHPRQLIQKMGKEHPQCVICSEPTAHARIKTCSLECAKKLKQIKNKEDMNKRISEGYYTREARKKRKELKIKYEFK